MPEMLFTPRAELFCLISQPWWRQCMSQPAERSTRAELRACHHPGMEEIEEEVAEVETGETMADPEHLTDTEMTGTGEDLLLVVEMTTESLHTTGEVVTMMMMAGEVVTMMEVAEVEAVAGDEEGSVATIMMMIMVVIMTTGAEHLAERTRKTNFLTTWNTFTLKMIPWPPEHSSLVTWSSTSLWRR